MRALGNGIQNYYGSLSIQAGPGLLGLVVNGAASTQTMELVGATGTGANIKYVDGNTGNRNWTAGAGVSVTGSFEIYDNTAGAQRFQISSTGAATFNTPTSGTTLTAVSGGGAAAFLVSNAFTASVTDLAVTRSTGNGTANSLNSGANILVNNSTNGFVLQNSGGQTELWQENASTWTQRWFVDTSGNLNISNGAGSLSPVYAGLPQNAIGNANYTTVLSDANKGILQNNTGHTITFPSNASVAYPVGTLITIVNGVAVTTTISAADTIYWAATGGTGSRTLGSVGMATMYRVNTGAWIISGSGLS